MQENLTRQQIRAKERSQDTSTVGPKLEEKPVKRSVRRFSKKVNAKMVELVNAWFKERAKMEDPDSQESLDSLNKYNKLWMNYCYKNLSKPVRFKDKFLEICDEEDRKMRKQVEFNQKMTKFTEDWKVRADMLQAEGKNTEEIAQEFDKYAQECNIPVVAKKKETVKE